MKKKLTMIRKKGLTLEEVCNLLLENCRQRDLREGSIRHYKDCYLQLVYTILGKRKALPINLMDRTQITAALIIGVAFMREFF